MTEAKVDIADRVIKNHSLIVVGTDLLREVLMEGDKLGKEERERQSAVAYLALLAVQGSVLRTIMRSSRRKGELRTAVMVRDGVVDLSNLAYGD